MFSLPAKADTNITKVLLKCAHPQEIEAEDLELIACALSYLSEIMDVIDKYETT